MNVTSLYEGMVLKNYKELCKQMDIPVKTGKSKQLQMRDVERYVKLEKHGRSFTVVEIYDTPVEKVSKKIDFVDDICILLLVYFATIHEETVQVAKKTFLTWADLVNDDYYLLIDRKDSFYSYEGYRSLLTSFNVRDFYKRSGRKFSALIESGLNRLKDQGWIFWEFRYVCHKKTKSGEIETKTLWAHEFEEKLRPVLKSFGFSSIREAVIKNRYDEVCEAMNKRYRWTHFYKVYHVFRRKRGTIRRDDLEEIKDRVVNNVIVYLDREAERLYLKNKQSDATFKYRKNYVESQQLLSELLLTRGKKYHSVRLESIADAEGDLLDKWDVEQQLSELFV